MTSRVVTLALDGNPTLDEYVQALNGMRRLLATFPSDTPIDWVVEDLAKGSAVTTFRGEAEDMAEVERAAQWYLEVPEQAELNPAILPADTYSAFRQIVSVINGRVPSITFETADNEVEVSVAHEWQPDEEPVPLLIPVPPPAPPATELPGAYGAIEGRIQTLSSRSGLTFTLFDSRHDKAVRCFLQTGQEGMIRDMWDQRAIVEGWVRRDSRGRPKSIRRIRSLTPISEQSATSWRDLEGIVSSSVPAETIIRRLRDA